MSDPPDHPTLPADVELIPGLDSPDIVAIERVDASPKGQDASDVSHVDLDHTAAEKVPPVSESLAELVKLNVDVSADLESGGEAQKPNVEPSHAEQSVIETVGHKETPGNGGNLRMDDSNGAEPMVVEEVTREDDTGDTQLAADDPTHVTHQPNGQAVESDDTVLQETSHEPTNSSIGDMEPEGNENQLASRHDIVHSNGGGAPVSEEIPAAAAPNEYPIEARTADVEETKIDAHDRMEDSSGADAGREEHSPHPPKSVEVVPTANGEEDEEIPKEEADAIDQADHEVDKQDIQTEAKPNTLQSDDAEDTKLDAPEESIPLDNASTEKEDKEQAEADAETDLSVADGKKEPSPEAPAPTEHVSHSVEGADAPSVTALDEGTTSVANQKKDSLSEHELAETPYETPDVLQVHDGLTADPAPAATNQDTIMKNTAGPIEETASHAEESLANGTSLEAPISTIEEQSTPFTTESVAPEPEDKPEEPVLTARSPEVAASNSQETVEDDKEAQVHGVGEVEPADTSEVTSFEPSQRVPPPTQPDALAVAELPANADDDNTKVLNDDESEHKSAAAPDAPVDEPPNEPSESKLQVESDEDDVVIIDKIVSAKVLEAHGTAQHAALEELQRDVSPGEDGPSNVGRITEDYLPQTSNTLDSEESPDEVRAQATGLDVESQKEVSPVVEDVSMTLPVRGEEVAKAAKEVSLSPQEHAEDPIAIPPATTPEEPAGSDDTEGEANIPEVLPHELPRELAEKVYLGHSSDNQHPEHARTSIAEENRPTKIEEDTLISDHKADMKDPIPIEGEYAPPPAPQIHESTGARPVAVSDDHADAQAPVLPTIESRPAEEDHLHDLPADNAPAATEFATSDQIESPPTPHDADTRQGTPQKVGTETFHIEGAYVEFVDNPADDTDQGGAQPAMSVKEVAREVPTQTNTEQADAQHEVFPGTESRENIAIDRNASDATPARVEGLVQPLGYNPLPLMDETTHATAEDLPIASDSTSTDASRPDEKIERVPDDIVLPLVEKTTLPAAEESPAAIRPDEISTREDRPTPSQGGEASLATVPISGDVADSSQDAPDPEAPDLTDSETPKNALADITRNTTTILHADPEAVENLESEEVHSLLERVHDRAFSGDSIEGLPRSSPEESGDVPPTPYQYVAASEPEESMELQESRLTPVQTSIDPDVVIIQDDHVPFLGEHENADSVQVSSTELSGGLSPPTPPSEPQLSPTGGASKLLVGDPILTQEISDAVESGSPTQIPEPAQEDQPDNADSKIVSRGEPLDFVYSKFTAEMTDKQPNPTYDVDESAVTQEAEAETRAAQLIQEGDETPQKSSAPQIVEDELPSQVDPVAEAITPIQEPALWANTNDIDTTASESETQTFGVSATPYIVLVDAPAAENEKPVKPEPNYSLFETPSIPLEAEESVPAMAAVIDHQRVNPEASAEDIHSGISDAEYQNTAPESQPHIPDAKVAEEPAVPSEMHDIPRKSRLDELEAESDGSVSSDGSPTMAKGPRITRILLDRPSHRPQAEPSLEDHTEAVAPEEATPVAEENNLLAEVDADRSDVPEVATTPRSDFGILTPTFDSRSEVSAASNEPIAPVSPRTDPSSPMDGDFDLPVLSLNGTLAPATDPEIIAKPGGPSEAMSEASMEPVPPSSPTQEITPLSTPTRQYSMSESPAHFLDATTSSDGNAQEMPTAGHAETIETSIAMDETKRLGHAYSPIPGAASDDLQSPPHSIHGELTPRKLQGDLPRQVPDVNALHATNSPTPTPPTTSLPSADQSLKDIPIKDTTNLLQDMQAQELQGTGKSEPSGSASHEGEKFPSRDLKFDPRDRPAVQHVPMPQDEDDEPSNKPAYLDVPPTKPRIRLVSTASSRLLPGGWSDSPRPQGRASLEMATGEFSPPIRPQSVGEEGEEGVTDTKQKSRLSCVIM